MTISLSPVTTTAAPLPADADALSVWPASARPFATGDVTVGGVSLAEAADRFGTPLYVLDDMSLRDIGL
jgi:diaminopimelate decarboxylase